MEEQRRKDGSPMSDGINNNTYEILFGDNYNLPKEEWQEEKYIKAVNAIIIFTMIKSKKITYTFLKAYYTILQQYNLNKIHYNKDTNKYIYEDEGVYLSFDLLSNKLENKELKKELTSKKRNGKCHVRSINIATNTENSKIVTGYATFANKRILHSVIEMPGKKSPVILDWTMNLIMSKEDYYKFSGFKELNSVKGEDVVDDVELIIDNIKLGCKAYLLFRDEIIREMKSKPELFKITEKGENDSKAFKSMKNNK